MDFLSRSFLSFLIIKLEKAIFVFGEVCLTFLPFFLIEFRELIPLMITFVPACIIIQSGFPATNVSTLSTIVPVETSDPYVLIF